MGDLGMNIRRRREALGLNKVQLAKRMGASDVAVGYWESGEIEQIGHLRLLALAKALECSVSELLDDPALPALVAEQQVRLLDWALNVDTAVLPGKLAAKRERLRAVADHRPIAWA